MNDYMMGEDRREKKLLSAMEKYQIGQNLNDPVVVRDAIKQWQDEEKWNQPDARLRPQGSLDYMAGAYYAQNPIASQAKYGSSISGEMMPGAKRAEEQNKTGMNPLYSDPDFIKYIAQYGFDRYGRKIRR